MTLFTAQFVSHLFEPSLQLDWKEFNPEILRSIVVHGAHLVGENDRCPLVRLCGRPADCGDLLKSVVEFDSLSDAYKTRMLEEAVKHGSASMAKVGVRSNKA